MDEAQSSLVQIDFSQITAISEELSVHEVAFNGYINLRGSSDNAEFMSAISSSLGCELPLEANTYVAHASLIILWLSYDEWMIVTPGNQLSLVMTKLSNALTNVVSAVTDVSGGNTIIEISGSSAIALLQKATPLDIHQSVFTVGECAQTVIAHSNGTIYKTDDKPTFRLLVRRSFADYLGLWIIDAAREFSSQ